MLKKVKGDAYRDKDAVEVSGFCVVVVAGAGGTGAGGEVHGTRFSQDLREAPQAGHAEDIDVVLAAESLQQSEVDLQSNIVLVLLVCGQHAQHHAVWIPARESGEPKSVLRPLRTFKCWHSTR